MNVCTSAAQKSGAVNVAAQLQLDCGIVSVNVPHHVIIKMKFARIVLLK
jgi:hypothetical protein